MCANDNSSEKRRLASVLAWIRVEQSEFVVEHCCLEMILAMGELSREVVSLVF